MNLEPVPTTAKKGPILVVEDDEETRETFAMVLADEGFRTVSAADGAEALALLRRSDAERPCVILLDFVLPVMDAVKLRRALAADERLRDIPIVIISGDPRVGEKAAGIGAACILKKPVGLAELLDALRPFCRDQSLRMTTPRAVSAKT